MNTKQRNEFVIEVGTAINKLLGEKFGVEGLDSPGIKRLLTDSDKSTELVILEIQAVAHQFAVLLATAGAICAQDTQPLLGIHDIKG